MNTHVVDEHENSPLRVENGRPKKWRENHDHVVIFAFHVCCKRNLDLSIVEVTLLRKHFNRLRGPLVFAMDFVTFSKAFLLFSFVVSFCFCFFLYSWHLS